MKTLKSIIMLCCLLMASGIAKAQSSHWTCDERSFEYSMSLYISASLYHNDITDFGNYEIGAFCGEECRGLLSIQNTGDVEYGYLRIRSNVMNGESITFNLYDKQNDKVISCDSIVPFVANSRIGYPSEPYKLNFGNGYVVTVESSNIAYGSVSGGGDYDSGSQVTLLASPNEGYHFEKWSNGVTDNPYVFTATENISLTAIFQPNKYKLIYKVDDEVYKSLDVDYASEITPEEEPTKEGYTFSGWSEIPATMPANDVEVTGTFTINQYKVTFIVDGEVVKEETLDFGTNITAPENPTKVGHTFTGWNPAVDATVPSHDVTYTAQFTVNQYTITFDTDGGSEIAPITQDYNSTVTAPSDPTKTGYTFTGWDKEIPATMPAENITVKALWTINKYMLTYKVDGEVYNQYEVEYNATIIPEAAPVKEGHTFSGWSEIPTTMPAYDVEINGSFSLNKYLLTYMVDGETYHQDSIAYGSTIVLIDEPVKEGKTFSGWKGAPEKMPAHDVTVVGSFNTNVYTLTYRVDGEVYKSVQYEYGEAIMPEPAPSKEGYSFSGWSEIPSTMPANDVEVTGTFTINQYKVTFIVDGEIIKQETLDFGTAITTPENPTKIGHTFTGWNPAVEVTVPSHDVTYVAMFEINTYKLTYYVDGVEYKEFEVEFGSEIIPEENPVKEGYNFSGWSEIPQFMPDHDVDVYGTFTISAGINIVKSESKNEDIYDLSGNKMTRTKKGINIINGKKSLIK